MGGMARIAPLATRVPAMAAVLAVLSGMPGLLHAQVRFVATELGSLGGAEDRTEARAIDAFGRIAGSGSTSAGERAFLWSGTMDVLGTLPGQTYGVATAVAASAPAVGYGGTPFGVQALYWQAGVPAGIGLVPGFTANLPAGVNSAGQVIGQLRDDVGFLDRGYLWQDGAFTLFTDAPGGSSEAAAVNASGVVVGSTWLPGAVRALRWQAGVRTELPDLPGGADHAEALAVNDAGQVTGFGSGPDGERAVLWDGGAATDLGDLPGGAYQSVARGINDARQVVGSSGAAGGWRAFLWSPQSGMRDLNGLLATPSPWVLVDAVGIDPTGRIAANAVDGTRFRALLLTPTGVLQSTAGPSGNLLAASNWQPDAGFTAPGTLLGAVVAAAFNAVLTLSESTTLYSLTVGGSAGHVTLGVTGGATLTLANPSAIRAGSTLSVGDGTVRFDGGLDNGGELAFSAGSREVTGNLALSGSGRITVSGPGTTRFTGTVVAQPGTAIVVDAGATVVFEQGVVGPVSWSGNGTKTFAGDVYLGTACVTDPGNAGFTAGATLGVEIAGPSPCTQHGRLAVGQTLSPGGAALRVILSGGYVPAAGQRFTVLQWGSRVGSFGNVDLSQAVLPAGLEWDTGSVNATGEIAVRAVNGGGGGGSGSGSRVVPMPGWSLLLLAAAIAAKAPFAKRSGPAKSETRPS